MTVAGKLSEWCRLHKVSGLPFPKSLLAQVSNAAAAAAVEEECWPAILQTMAMEGGDLERMLSLRPHLPLSTRPLFAGLLSPLNLELRRIQWEHTSAFDLQLIAKHDLIHGIRSIGQLRQRLGPNRRCYAWYHPRLPHHPLVILHVALCSEWPCSLTTLLSDPQDNKIDNPTIACFYSVANGHEGVSGLGLAEALIKRSLGHLQSEHPSLQVFTTMSPIPGFTRWLKSETTGDKLVEQYLSSKRAGHLLDSVAHFHLRNGACLRRLIGMSDAPDYIMDQSKGFMAHYEYVPDLMEERAWQYAVKGDLLKSTEFEIILR